MGVKSVLLCTLLCVPTPGCRPASAATLCVCSKTEGWCADYLEGRKAVNLGDLEAAAKLLDKARKAHPSDDCRIEVNNYPERYRPFYYLSRVQMELGNCLLAWDSWEQSPSHEALPAKKSRLFAEELERNCGPCDQDYYRRIVARAEEKVASCRTHAESWPGCHGIEGDRRRLSARCALAEEQLKAAAGSHSPARAQEAASLAAGAIDELRTLFCRRCDDECDERKELDSQIGELAREARQLGEDPLGARFVTLIEAIDSLLVEYRDFPRDAPPEDLREVRDRLRAEIRLLNDSITAARFQELADGVVKIETGSKAGTGIIVNLGEGVADILTVTHVVDGGQEISVFFHTQPQLRFGAEQRAIQGEDRTNGLAVVRVQVQGELPPARCLPLAEIEPAAPTPIYIIGMPHASRSEWTITSGSVAGRIGPLMSLEVRSFGPGNSGGPVISSGSRVVGMVTSESESGGFVQAVPSPILRSTLPGWGIELCD